MKDKYRILLKNILITVSILIVCFALCLLLRHQFQDVVLIPALFILGAFLTAVLTEGYGFGKKAVCNSGC